MKLNHLSILTTLLFVISLGVYTFENKKGTDLVSGSDFIKGLDVEGIQKIVIKYKKEKDIVLERDSDKFLIGNHKSYPASTEKINDIIYKIASLQVKTKVASNVKDEDLDKYDLGEKSKNYQVEIYDKNGRKSVSFRVGKDHKNRGNFLIKDGTKDVYLANKTIWFDETYTDFINKNIFNIKLDDIKKITLKNQDLVELEKKEKEFELIKPSNKKVRPDKVTEYVENLTSISFDDFYKYSDNEVSHLNFKNDIRIKLNNQVTYKVNLAQKDKSYFLKVSAFTSDMPDQLVIQKNDDQEKIKDIEKIIKAQDMAQKFNLEKGNWVYKIDKSSYEGLTKKKDFFL